MDYYDISIDQRVAFKLMSLAKIGCTAATIERLVWCRCIAMAYMAMA